jgi:Holliday junction resolvase RusA-like endonuclease
MELQMQVEVDDIVLGSLILRISELPIPPSINQLYFTKGGRRILTADGRIYKDCIKSALAELGSNAKDLEIPELHNHKLSIRMDFFLGRVENKSWSSGKTQTRFKKVDISNRVKVLEDALVEGLGIDDSQFFNMFISKSLVQDGKPDYVNIHLYSLEAHENNGTRH